MTQDGVWCVRGVSHVMRSINVRYLLTYLREDDSVDSLTCPCNIDRVEDLTVILLTESVTSSSVRKETPSSSALLVVNKKYVSKTLAS